MNELETALQAAAADPGQRPRFYQVLLASDVFVLGLANPPADGGQLPAGAQVSLAHWQMQDGTQVIPFFTSLEILQQTISEPQSYLALNARALFEITAGMALILNPNQPFGKHFTPTEIAALLDGSLFRPPDQYTFEEETRVLLGQPSEYPDALVAALSSLFETRPEVRAAYLAWMAVASPQEEPHLVIGLDTGEGDVEAYHEVVRQAGMVVHDVMPGKLVDFIRIGSGTISDYMTGETEPFYTSITGI